MTTGLAILAVVAALIVYEVVDHWIDRRAARRAR